MITDIEQKMCLNRGDLKHAKPFEFILITSSINRCYRTIKVRLSR